MTVLVLGRLFSGLADGLAEGVWRPRGAPAFYKLVEGLAAEPGRPVRTLLFCKEPDSRFPRRRRGETDAAGPIEVVPWRALTGGRSRALDRIATELDHARIALAAALRRDVALVYGTWGCVLALGLIARLTRRPVVLRLMGIFPQHRALAAGAGGPYRWAVRAPYALVVCTEDGSDPAAVMERLVRPGVPTAMRLNGCDATPGPERPTPSGRALRIVFLGRLEGYKGADIFVDAVLAAARRLPEGALSAEMIGDGPLRETLTRTIEAAEAGSVLRLRGAVDHAAVTAALQAADVYVSVNLHGNLSNANLEALAAGCALVIPTSDPDTPIDTATDRLLPEGTVLRFDRGAPTDSLAEALVALAEDPDAVVRLQRTARERAAALLKPWTDRIVADKRQVLALARGAEPDLSPLDGKG